MKRKLFKPSPKYLIKSRVIITLLALLIFIVAGFFAWLIGADKGVDRAIIFSSIVGGIVGIGWVIAMLLMVPYYRSLSYEIHEDEVIVHVGIVTKSVKHVPYRTVTNIAVKRGIFDRWFFDLGTLNIQTAGMSGTQGAEEKLEGLPNVQEVYDIVATELRRFRGSMSPTTAEVENETAVSHATLPSTDLKQLLAEVQAIRHAVEAR
ncbi:MAG: PH domain-containing protein [Chloroflexi bacterium]|nr:PH domain-containing protein [Chloroflexota bacterium]